jgi:hypothetical protein
VLLPPSLHPVLSREVYRIRRTVDLRVEHTEDRSRVLIASEAVLVRTRGTAIDPALSQNSDNSTLLGSGARGYR